MCAGARVSGARARRAGPARQVIDVELPAAVQLKVVDTTGSEKGNTVSGGTKAATLETGAVIQVPMFINVDDLITVDTRSGEYLSRTTEK